MLIDILILTKMSNLFANIGAKFNIFVLIKKFNDLTNMGAKWHTYLIKMSNNATYIYLPLAQHAYMIHSHTKLQLLVYL
jgi:hypothetical protein